MATYGWCALQTKFPERAKMGQQSSVGGTSKLSKYSRSPANDTVVPLHTLVLDTKAFFYIFQDPGTLKTTVNDMVKKVEVKWNAKNKGRPAGCRCWPEERHVQYYYPPSPDGGNFGTFILLVASTWHFTSEVQYESGQPKFNPNKVRIQVKPASANFNSSSMMMEGGSYLYYNDFLVLMDSAEMGKFLDKVAAQVTEDKHPSLEQQKIELHDLYEHSGSYRSDVLQLNKVNANLGGEGEGATADEPKGKKTKKAAGGSKKTKKDAPE